MTKRRPVDQQDRDKAIHERKRNVVINAGAGTGKTTLLVTRLLQLIAPDDDGPAMTLDRIAAITFTRKAAGELKLRLREALLTQVAQARTPTRTRRLADALELLDNASISTVHSFADRLLRLRPIDAQLSPGYEIAEDPSVLVEETLQSLLSEALRDAEDPLEREAYETITMFQAVGLLVRTQETDWFDRLGLDAFVWDVIDSRDRPLNVPKQLDAPDLPSVRRHLDELRREVRELTNDSEGSKRLRRLCQDALRIVETEHVDEVLRRAVSWYKDLQKSTKSLTESDHFPEDATGWDAYKWIARGTRGTRKTKVDRPDGPLGAAMVEPLFAYMAKRLVRLQPLILRRYKEIKRAHGLVDQIDLLIQLRDLLRRDPSARAFYQQRFDHLLVDEFQDTDPLQAEIVMYLCEQGAVANNIEELKLQPGKLTIVGDPKQSIYRFRRADIAMYAAVCEKLRSADACEAQLTVNFRSADAIISWVNEGFDAVLGTAEDGTLYDPEKGTVANVRLEPADKTHGGGGVHILPFGDAELKAEALRDLEGEALAHYIRHLVEESDLRIIDPRTRELRRPNYGDVAIMMIATQTVHHLTSELDRIGVPHVVRGGTLFMQDPLHRQFVLGLRALSDARDGVARAALMRPPFFAVSLEDLARGLDPDAKSEALQATETLITELRRDRHRGTPGEVARQVLERTGFGRYIAAGVNGEQRLARLYELCLALDELARSARLDFDGVTNIARSWLDAPPRIEAPLPVDAAAVQVITAHQAKGLEWPIVALWDGRAGWRANLPQLALTVDSANGDWALKLDGLTHDPTDKGLSQRETELRAAERKRVAYVAATRARDLLIVPEAGEVSDKNIAGKLIGAGSKLAQRVAPYKSPHGDWWKGGTPVSMQPIAAPQPDLATTWQQTAKQALTKHLSPVGITTIAHLERTDLSEPIEAEPTPKQRIKSRHGPIFGSTVHRALALLLERGLTPETATHQAAQENQLTAHLDLALEDVLRAHKALRTAGLLDHPLQTEYPLAGTLSPESLMAGFIDLLIAAPAQWYIVDFKTDSPPNTEVHQVYPAYVEQIRLYTQVIQQSGITEAKPVRAGLLFTGDGQLCWV